MRQQLNTMLDLQQAINCQIDQAWMARDFPWYRAIWVECAELLDHHGWKWWKQQPPDLEQVKLELVDIWHFGLSLLLQRGLPREQLVAEIERQLREPCASADFRVELERFVQQVLATRDFDVAGFGRLLAGAGLGFEDLYLRYVGKNVLNRFRQDHGYRDGSYRKFWHGREDNEHLIDVAEQLDSASANFQFDLYQALAHRYRESAA